MQQTLSEFRTHWQPLISRQAKDIGARVEAGRDMSRFLDLEPVHRAAVDKLVRDYSVSLSFAPDTLSFDLGYLLHLRLLQAGEFAQFLDHCGLGSAQMSAPDWIQF